MPFTLLKVQWKFERVILPRTNNFPSLDWMHFQHISWPVLYDFSLKINKSASMISEKRPSNPGYVLSSVFCCHCLVILRDCCHKKMVSLICTQHSPKPPATCVQTRRTWTGWPLRLTPGCLSKISTTQTEQSVNSWTFSGLVVSGLDWSPLVPHCGFFGLSSAWYLVLTTADIEYCFFFMIKQECVSWTYHIIRLISACLDSP